MIIALKGPAQCGKSTLAGMLEVDLKRRGVRVTRTAFGDFVRAEIAEQVLEYRDYRSCNDSDCNTCGSGRVELSAFAYVALNEFDKTVPKKSKLADVIQILESRPARPESRNIQQVWGQDFRRAQDPFYWIKKSFAHNVEFLLQDNTILIEESCRQPNEGQYVRALGGIILDLKPLPSPTESEAAAMSHSVEQIATSWEGDMGINMEWVFKQPKEGQDIWVRDLVSQCLIKMGVTFGRTEAPH